MDTGAPAWCDLSLHRPVLWALRRLGFGTRAKSFGGGVAGSAGPAPAGRTLGWAYPYGVENCNLDSSDDSLGGLKVVEGLLSGL